MWDELRVKDYEHDLKSCLKEKALRPHPKLFLFGLVDGQVGVGGATQRKYWPRIRHSETSLLLCLWFGPGAESYSQVVIAMLYERR